MTKLLLIHGRGQGGKDPERLKLNWSAGLNAGLTLAGHASVDPDQLLFPFYGDLLEAEKLRAQAAATNLDLESATDLRDQHIDPLMPDELAELESDLLRSMAEQAASQPGVEMVEAEGVREHLLRIPGARALADFIARHTGADAEIIENFLPDVAVYLRVARETVLNVVRQALELTDDRLIIIAHSLGGAVARDLLDDASVPARTDLFLTVGTPLGLDAVYRNLKTPGPAHPNVENWVTVFDPDDFVTLGHPLLPLYHEPLEDLRVDNPTDDPHGIEHYLGHAHVAARIAAALAD